MVQITFKTNSAKVLPKQMRLPPLKGSQAYLCRYFPDGVFDRGWAGSNLSGRYSCGRCHYAELRCTSKIEIVNGV